MALALTLARAQALALALARAQALAPAVALARVLGLTFGGAVASWGASLVHAGGANGSHSPSILLLSFVTPYGSLLPGAHGVPQSVVTTMEPSHEFAWSSQ